MGTSGFYFTFSFVRPTFVWLHWPILYRHTAVLKDSSSYD